MAEKTLSVAALPRGEDMAPADFRSRRFYFAVWLTLAGAAIATEPAGTDYLVYYLPAAAAILDGSWLGAHFSVAQIDAPLAYPPLEYFLLLPAVGLETLPGLYVRLLLCAKLAFLLFLLHRLELDAGLGLIWRALLLVPALAYFSLINSTDLNALIGALGILWLYVTPGSLVVPGIAIGVGLLSKYTFFPAYVLGALFFLILKPRALLAFLPAGLVFALFLAKNWYQLGNPVFPLLYDVFASPDQYDAIVRGVWLKGLEKAGMASVLRATFYGMMPMSIALFMNFLKKQNQNSPRIQSIVLAICFALYFFIFLFGMNPPNVGESSRFLLPLASIIFFCLARLTQTLWRSLLFSALLALACALLTKHWLYAYFLTGLCVSTLLLSPVFNRVLSRPFAVQISRLPLHAFWPGRQASYSFVIVATLMLFAAAKTSQNLNLSMHGLGYDRYSRLHNHLQSALERNLKVLSDLEMTPYSLRRDRNHTQLYSSFYNQGRRIYKPDCTYDRYLLKEQTVKQWSVAEECGLNRQERIYTPEGSVYVWLQRL